MRDNANLDGEKDIGDPDNNTGEYRVVLSAPWEADRPFHCAQTMIGSSKIGPSDFITQRTRAHELYIREQEKTKRLWLILSVVLLISALALMLFAPQGRETLSYWIGGSLLVFSAGAAGYKRIWGKSKIFSVTADQDKRNIE